MWQPRGVQTLAPVEPAAPPEPIVDEVAGVVRLAGALIDQLTVPVHDTHRAVADRIFRTLGPVAFPARMIHDATSGLAYGSVRMGARIAGATAGAAMAATHRKRDVDRAPISAHPLGAQTNAFVSGLLGDWLDTRAVDLRVRLGLTHHGRPVPTDPDALVRAIAAARQATAEDHEAAATAETVMTERLVLLVHGLAETTAAWRWWSTDGSGARIPTYAELLEAHGWTPLEVAYDTGRPVADSGRDLAELIQRLADGWPRPIEEIALVGHSMGGLVVSAAAHHGLSADMDWPERVRHVVSLGSPHAGSWFAKAAAGAVQRLGRLPETKAVADVIELRSPGIRDLTHGWEPWRGGARITEERRAAAIEAAREAAASARDLAEGAAAASEAAARAAARTLTTGGSEGGAEAEEDEAVPGTLPALLPAAHHWFVSSTLGSHPRHPLARLFGDGLVHPHSATAPATGRNVTVRHHVGIGHIRLVHHPAVGDDLAAWLGPRASEATAD